LTFDKKRVDWYSQGEYWIVKSDTVSIQGRYMPTPITHGLSVTKELAISGPFINNHKLRISATTATWDGKPILNGFPSSWSNANPPVSVQYNDQGGLVDKGLKAKDLHIVHINLPLGVILQVNRWINNGPGDYINIKITMPPQPNQDGHCGNFNGNPDDDARLQIRARVGATGVDPSDLLFGHKTPTVVANRPDMNNCPDHMLKKATKLCGAKSENGIPHQGCIIDVCFGGEAFANQG
jgi:hypothetical protein